MTTIERPPDADSVTRSIQWRAIGELTPVPSPLIRITTCGLLTLELFEEITSADPLQARYRVLTPDLLHGRGKVPALTLLKLLVSRPDRFAPGDWLLEAFCRAQGETFSSKRLDTLAWMLRDLLCPPAYQQIRTSLVVHSRGLSGPGYRLASYPLVWVDHEALAWNVEQAIRMERFGDNPLPFWQRAYELAKRGEYLPDEIYGEWSTPKREEIASLLRQSVQALARLYAEKQDKASEEEALLLLRSYWQQHPRDEDVLRPLMELLGRRDCYQEALEYYAKLWRLLEEDGQQPVQQTLDVVEYVRTKQIQRTSLREEIRHRGRRQLLQIHASTNIFSTTDSGHQILTPSTMARAQQEELFFSLRAEQLALLSLLGFREEKVGFDESKRDTLQKIATALLAAAHLPTIESLALPDLEPWERLLMAQQKQSPSVAINTATLEHFERLLITSWQLCDENQFDTAEGILVSFLPQLLSLSRHDPRTASLTSHSLRLRSIIAHHRSRLNEKTRLCEQSVNYARQTGDANTLVPALLELSSAYEYSAQHEMRMQVLQEALSLSVQTSPLLQSRTYSLFALLLAENKRVSEASLYIRLAQEIFPDEPVKDPNMILADSNLYHLSFHSGLVSMYTQSFEQAFQAFDYYLQFPSTSLFIPERIRLEIVNGKSKVAILVNDAERYAEYLKEVLNGALNIGSKKRFDEALGFFRQEMPRTWLAFPQIKELTEHYSLTVS
jgi:tetratricopeptide (TPR) repeat protein